jgi:dihydroorotate dehydrogenase (fumarate)
MTNLTTTYLGLKLRSPLVPSASPLSESVDNIKRMEDAGAGAVVLYSLFEEQLRMERQALWHYLTHGSESYAEAVTYMPQLNEFHADSRGYMEHIRKAKAAVHIPIIASLNGVNMGNWVKVAQQMENAGADAIELNEYTIPTDMDKSGADVEDDVIALMEAVRAAVNIPVAIKLSPFFSNMANMAKRLDTAGADGLVLFNRFYQPDLDLETLEVKPNIILSTPQALRLPMRWIAILYGRINASLAATSGVHTAEDVVKMILVGANVTMMAAALLKHGINHLREVETGLRRWMEEHEYESVTQMRGAVSQINCEDPAAFERAQYMKALTHYTPEK